MLSLTRYQQDWTDLAKQLDAEGFAVIADVLSPDLHQTLHRQMQHHCCVQSVAFPAENQPSGSGGKIGIFPLDEPLVAELANLRAALYPHLVPVANRWNQLMDIPCRYPLRLETFMEQNQNAGQRRPLSHVSLLRDTGFVSLHQRTEGELVFPLQIVGLLTEPGRDFQGGEFVMTEQRPRMQSRPLVIPLGKGDIAIIATAHRPYKGSKGYYRVNSRHAISRVLSGERIGFELSFHNAP